MGEVVGGVGEHYIACVPEAAPDISLAGVDTTGMYGCEVVSVKVHVVVADGLWRIAEFGFGYYDRSQTGLCGDGTKRRGVVVDKCMVGGVRFFGSDVEDMGCRGGEGVGKWVDILTAIPIES